MGVIVIDEQVFELMQDYLRRMFIKEAEATLSGIDVLFNEIKPGICGKRYLTNEEVIMKLHLSQRCLQKYRDTGILPLYSVFFIRVTVFEEEQKKRSYGKPGLLFYLCAAF